MEDRVIGLERAITKLVVIQEEQTKQTDKLINSVTDLSAMMVLVEQNTTDINKMGNKLSHITDTVHTNHSDLHHEVEKNRIELDKLGQSRLWKGLSIGVGALVFAFGYLYSDIKHVNDSYMHTVVHQTRVITFMDDVKGKLSTIVNEVEKIKNKNRPNGKF